MTLPQILFCFSYCAVLAAGVNLYETRKKYKDAYRAYHSVYLRR